MKFVFLCLNFEKFIFYLRTLKKLVFKSTKFMCINKLFKNSETKNDIHNAEFKDKNNNLTYKKIKKIIQVQLNMRYKENFFKAILLQVLVNTVPKNWLEFIS